MSKQAKFLTGNIMRHVVVMTMTGSFGLMFMFSIDIVTLFWVSRLGDERHIASLGFVWIILLFTLSIGIGFSIAANALVSRSLGQENHARARQQTTVSMIVTLTSLTILAGLVLVYKTQILTYAGAEGQTLSDASRYLGIVIPSLPIMALGMVGSSVLRAIGDPVRAMSITLISGVVVMILDPILIIWMGLGLDGAAYASIVARVCTGGFGVYYLIVKYDMMSPLSIDAVQKHIKPYLAIALPAVLTGLATPFGNYIVTVLMSGYGDSALADWSVVSRVYVFVFAGLFSLSGAIGGIFGQNYGAALFGRVRQTYKNSLTFCIIYAFIVAFLLWATSDLVIEMFHLSNTGAVVYQTFVAASIGYVGLGGLYVSNTAFNTLGRPIFSTGFNWLQSGLLLYPLAMSLSQIFGVQGIVYGNILAGLIVGIVAVISGWLYIENIEAIKPMEREKDV